MNTRGSLRAENETLRTRLSTLTDAILRISEDLELDVVLQEVVDSARSLTGARYSAIITVDDAGKLQDLLISGLTPEETQQVMKLPGGTALFGYLTAIDEPIRSADFVSLIRSLGIPEINPPISTFMGTAIRVRERHVGNIFIGGKTGGPDFTDEDVETLEIFATQAAMAITNARRYGNERQAKADLEALINTSPIGVLVYDARTREVVKSNGEALRIFAGPSGEEQSLQRLLGVASFRRMDGQEIPPAELPLERVVSTGETVRAEEIVVHIPGGGTVSTLVNATPIHSEEGEIISVVATIQDITPLEELERLRAEFLGQVSHELRAPLTSIKGSAATVLESSAPLDPIETRQFFRIIEEQADHMRDLINNLLDLSRIEAGSLSVSLQPTDIAMVMEQAKNAFHSSGYRNTVELDPVEHLPKVTADGQRIAQVLYNLLANASRYSAQWSTIRVSAAYKGWHVAVTVSDEGVGIPPERLPQLFSKFSSVDSGREGQVRGHGLGLAISKGIVEAHGGRIWADSEGPDKGTQFTFTLPTADGPSESAHHSHFLTDEVFETEPVRSERILVIDDDPQVLRFVRRILTDAGYATTATADPAQLARFIESETPDLVLLNLILPGSTGFDLMSGIGEDFDIPVIFISGKGRGHDIAKAFELGAADYVVKPFSPTELLARIRAALHRHTETRPGYRPAPFVLGDVVINYVEQRVSVGGNPAEFTPTEYRLLTELSMRAGKVLTYDELVQRVWGSSPTGSVRLLRSFVKSIRQKLGDNARKPLYLFNHPGVGYSLARP